MTTAQALDLMYSGSVPRNVVAAIAPRVGNVYEATGKLSSLALVAGLRTWITVTGRWRLIRIDQGRFGASYVLQADDGREVADYDSTYVYLSRAELEGI